ncbi:hypothetical protein QAD02_009490 [Eretmocerus hayati]|uniref:Uncharacterized protein n=1 Tax=Eretmocerus hayati TaxID=131215 RepID=A0ACC2NBU5_9HYME|nr:hypothetical protein QAD02_009490 [Eretmocerus hayati]
MTEIKHRVSEMETFQTDDKHQLGEQLIAEAKERMHREKNIIIFGVDENDETDDLKEEIIFLLSGAPFSLEEIRVLRLGKADADKIRPVKVIFNSHEEAKWVLINQKSFCKDNMRCANDKTLLQQEYMRNLSVKLEEMKKAGSKNVRIKYIRNVPTIVKDGRPKQGTEPANGRRNGASRYSHVSYEDSSTNNVSALENQNDVMYKQRKDNSKSTKSNSESLGNNRDIKQTAAKK